MKVSSSQAIQSAERNLVAAETDRENDKFESAMIRASIGSGYARLAAVLQEQEWRDKVGRGADGAGG